MKTLTHKTVLKLQSVLVAGVMLTGVTMSASLAFAASESDGRGYSVGSLPSENTNTSPIIIGQNTPSTSASSTLGAQSNRGSGQDTNPTPGAFSQSNPNQGRTSANTKNATSTSTLQRGGLNGTRSGSNASSGGSASMRGSSSTGVNSGTDSGFGAGSGMNSSGSSSSGSGSLGGSSSTGAGTMGSGSR